MGVRALKLELARVSGNFKIKSQGPNKKTTCWFELPSSDPGQWRIFTIVPETKWYELLAPRTANCWIPHAAEQVVLSVERYSAWESEL
ncbi:hypothetical protein COR50_05475 [Chitinophaga caeni]|uniref:Uncharacterized protein n=1 Tax=Chitinophaga caeni TaxID=2029983 RepID=A0A291QRX0_9BACT|nr:hypothetical protein COR50_05475 [Chitinophaga caeni]